ncbi:6-phosphogluconate dehydrogenase, C-terminal [Dillenia turbinata]|uniref:phosphogluconate dehydrogenase (NADP(+)-dependent, decarboxylating) n=1 Tax=Dillenia turbinata TaxID=194707 RepID=A0AAN8VK68_9MAGN
MLAKASSPVVQTIKTLSAYLEEGDCIIDGGNEWYEMRILKGEKAMAEVVQIFFESRLTKGSDYLVDKVLDRTGMKATGKWKLQQAADLSVAAPTIASSLDAKFLSGLKEESVEAANLVTLAPSQLNKL